MLRLWLATFICSCRLCLGGQWSTFIEQTIADIRARLPSLDDEFEPEPEFCSHHWLASRFKVFLTTVVGDWLTSAATNFPILMGGLLPNVGANVSQHYGNIETQIGDALQMADLRVFAKNGCKEAQTAMDMFAGILKGESARVGFPGAPHLSWRQVGASQWPLFALASQSMRLLPQRPVQPLEDPCSIFVARIPAEPVDTSEIFSLAVRFLDTQHGDGALCQLATALAISIVVQDASHQLVVIATEVVAQLLAVSDSVKRHGTRATLFLLMDRATACPSRVGVTSPAGQRFPLYVLPRRDHISDQIRMFGNSHCALHERSIVDPEAEIAALLAKQPEEVFVVEVGAGFGQCLLPLLLADVRVKALAVEASRQARALMARSFESNGVADRVSLASAWITTNVLLASSTFAQSSRLIDVEHDLGHDTLAWPVAYDESLQALHDSLRRIDVRGDDALSAMVSHASEKASASLMTLSELIEGMHVDLLLVCPFDVCAEIASGVGIECERRLDTRGFGDHYCAFVNCVANSVDLMGADTS